VSDAAPVRRATEDDRDGVVEMVVAAFASDPAWGFMMASDYPRLAPHFAGALFDLRVPAGNVWTTDDRSATAMWNPPGPVQDPDRAREIWDRFRLTAGEEVQARVSAYNAAVAAAAPEEDYWYLGVLATDPKRRREGLAGRVLAPTLTRADEEVLGCCLETSTESNRRFYERRGFTEATDVELASGPPTWWLRRAPKA
jgi:GNAT superfamily N-acetyltransferase